MPTKRLLKHTLPSDVVMGVGILIFIREGVPTKRLLKHTLPSDVVMGVGFLFLSEKVCLLRGF